MSVDLLPPDLRARLDDYFGQRDLSDAQPVLLSGDASDRRYVRVTPSRGPTQILAVYPGPIEFARMPFASALALFGAMPVPVPRVLDYSDPLGIIAQEDLGDQTLAAHLEATSRADLHVRYREALALVAEMQRRGAELASPRFTPYELAFDVPKLTFELDFFVTHFLEGHRGAKLTPAHRAALATAFSLLADELAAEPRVVCHRDYHSRNLMVHGGGLVMIDFQDARLGPDTYDVASLLRDSYVELDGDTVDTLISYFLALDRGPVARDRDASTFRDRFDVMALQRNLKALGTFGYQATVRGKTGYLRDVPRTLRYLGTTFERQPRFTALRALLATHLPELQLGG
ncbi:MAG TPA: phosphotransferase [Vicinamibacterales bacterium]